MSFAVRIDSAPRALQRRLPWALAAFALGASLFALAFAEPSQRGTLALASLACFAIAFGRRRLAQRRPGNRRRSGPVEGSLSIDEAGRASWADASDAACDARPVRIERWNVLGPFAWLRLRVDGEPAAFDVLLARRPGRGARRRDREARLPGRDGPSDAAGENDWRRLRAWLLWYGRGAARAAALSGSARASQ